MCLAGSQTALNADPPSVGYPGLVRQSLSRADRKTSGHPSTRGVALRDLRTSLKRTILGEVMARQEPDGREADVKDGKKISKPGSGDKKPAKSD